MKPKLITAEILEEMLGKMLGKRIVNRCKHAAKQVDTFRREWPDGAEVTLENINRAIELNLNMEGFAHIFFSATALKAYKKARTPAVQAYLKARAIAVEARDKAIAPSWEACLKALAPDLYKAWQSME